MIKAQILGYRQWARQLFEHVYDYKDAQRSFSYIETTDEIDSDLVFAVGWSEMIPEEVYAKRTVLVLHPSPLPKYRGGTPIQHQIIAGETMSAVTLFKLDKDHPAVDSGPIVGQTPFSLEGDLSDILKRIAYFGARLVERAYDAFEDGGLMLVPQDEAEATTFKRRKPSESEIRRTEISGYGLGQGLALHNKIRALQDPYPNAYLPFADGKLYITQTRWEPSY